MIKHLVVAFFSVLLIACSQHPDPMLQADGLCQEPRPEICTMHYKPVCAEVANELVEYGNACSACGDPAVNAYQIGSCQK